MNPSRKGITLQPEKCQLGQPEVKWFGNIYSKHGVSPDSEKCAMWPPPKSNAEVKSFLQTVQFNSKSMDGGPGELFSMQCCSSSHSTLSS